MIIHYVLIKTRCFAGIILANKEYENGTIFISFGEMSKGAHTH